tara:strand:+ start:6331 stop:8814 length:2484 start_codon:yes stop_codon:yes gene_type:complete
MDPVLQRAMFSGQPPQAAGTGITSGLETTPEQEAQMESVLGDVAGQLKEMNDGIDNADDFVGIMNAIRGDNQSIEQRRNELAGYIGKEDAKDTPESALTLIQPSLTLLEATEQGSPETDDVSMNEGIMSALTQAPGQGEAMARMAMGEQPVMRAAGTPQTAAGGEGYEAQDYPIIDLTKGLFPGKTVPFAKNVNPQQAMLNQLLQKVPEAQTSAELLPKYKELYGDAGKAYELNPYISGLQLAAAIANAPEGELISSVLAPETIKAVSDPILEMAKAKGQSDLLAKKAAMEAATASASQESKSKQAILTAAVPKLLEREDLKFQTIGNKMYVIDPAAMREAALKGEDYTPMTLEGEAAPNFKTISLGEGQFVTVDGNTGSYTVGGTRNKEWVKIESKEGDVFMVNKADPNEKVTVQTGGGQVVGNATDGFARILDGRVTLLEIPGYTYPGRDQRTELMKNAERFGMLQAKENPTTAETAELKVLTKSLVGAEQGEFERVLESYIEDYRAQVKREMPSLSKEEVDRIVNDVEAGMLKDFIVSKNTPNRQFDPLAARNKASADSMIKQLDRVNETASRAIEFAGKTRIVAQTSVEGGFEGGILGPQRAAIGKLAKELGVEAFLADKLGVDNFEQYLGGATELAEVQRALGEALVVDLAANFPGNLNQTEIDILQSAVAGLGKTPEANEILALAMENVAARQRRVAEELGKVAQANQGKSDFELKLILDKAEVEINNKLNDPENNPELQGLMNKFEQYKKNEMTLANQEQDFISTEFANYQGTDAQKAEALKQDYSSVQQKYPMLFDPLPNNVSNAQINDFMLSIIRTYQ